MTLIKICGLTNANDALYAARAGADLLGFVFYPPSPRYVTPQTVHEIVLQVKQATPSPKVVGVFVDHPLDTIQHILQFCGLDLAQLHGQESPQDVAWLSGQAFKAINPRTLPEAESLAQRYAVPSAPFILLDAYHPTMPGGTGNTTDWDMAAAIAARYPVILAGGLNPANVAQAIIRIAPYGVDVSSGVEATKGKKDYAAITALIKAVRTTDQLRH